MTMGNVFQQGKQHKSFSHLLKVTLIVPLLYMQTYFNLQGHSSVASIQAYIYRMTFDMMNVKTHTPNLL